MCHIPPQNLRSCLSNNGVYVTDGIRQKPIIVADVYDVAFGPDVGQRELKVVGHTQPFAGVDIANSGIFIGLHDFTRTVLTEIVTYKDLQVFVILDHACMKGVFQCVASLARGYYNSKVVVLDAVLHTVRTFFLN